ncbi:MAG: hypothetical protein SGI77_22000 [Pirellulaceae bacterium]|nr:hypothetical protein [Pirellulaceae bacterium]
MMTRISRARQTCRRNCGLFFVCLVVAPLVSFREDSIGAESSALLLQEKGPAASDRQPVSEFEQLEADAIDFVKAHHPELVSLLQLLKSMREKEYETAIRDIGKARKRLESLEKREPETHAIELEAWKLQSKIDLLLAKGFARDKAFDTKLLQKLLSQQVENQKKRYRNEQANLSRRQDLVRELLGRIEGHEKEKIDQQFAALMKRVDAKAGKVNKTKPEFKPNQEATKKP